MTRLRALTGVLVWPDDDLSYLEPADLSRIDCGVCIHIRCVLVAQCVYVGVMLNQNNYACVCMFELIKVNTCALPMQPSLYSGQI